MGIGFQLRVYVCIVLVWLSSGNLSASDWSTILGIRMGFQSGPGEIGRNANATGEEDLIAYLKTTPVLGGEVGCRNRYLTFLARLSSGFRRVMVRNEFNVDFPNHGSAPTWLTGAVSVRPLGNSGWIIQPFITVEVGLLFLSVDLDNIQDQVFYALWTRSLGGGMEILWRENSYVYAEYLREWISENAPLQSFRANVMTFGVGKRF